MDDISQSGCMRLTTSIRMPPFYANKISLRFCYIKINFILYHNWYWFCTHTVSTIISAVFSLYACSEMTKFEGISIMNQVMIVIYSIVFLLVSGLVFQAPASDLFNPKKQYYAVFYRETKNGSCFYRTAYSQYYNNGKDAYYAKVPEGYKKYTAWCWEQD